MAASVNDYFNKVGSPGNATFLASPGHTISGTSFTVDSTSLWPTDTGVTFGIDTTSLVAGVVTRDAGSYTVWRGTVASGTTITNCVLVYGTDQNYTAGTTTRVYVLPTSSRENRIVDGLLLEHLNTGLHSTTLITNRTEDTAPDESADFILTYDTSATSLKKVKPSNLGHPPTGSIMPFAGRTAPTNWLMCFGGGISRTTYANLFAVISPVVGTFTTTIAVPGVVTLASHTMVTGDQVYLTTTGALPAGLAINTLYYVVYIDANTFNLATSRANAVAGTKITTTGTQSGVHTLNYCPYGLGDGTTTFNVPDARGRVLAGADAMGGTAATRLTLSKSQGSYGQVGASGGAEAHTLITAEMPAHTHGIGTNTAVSASGGGQTQPTAASGALSTSTGGDGSHNNIQPTLVTNYMIRI